jgi:ankyrin repeat protein
MYIDILKLSRNRVGAIGALLIGCYGFMAAGTSHAQNNEVWLTAVQRNDVALLQEKLGSQQNIEQATAKGKTALMAAAAAGASPLVKQLLIRGAGIDTTNVNGGTALMYAAVGGHSRVVRQLLARGANIDAQGRNGWSALTLAAVKDHRDTVSALIGAGCEVNSVDIQGWTPLMRAVAAGNRDVVRELLNAETVLVNKQNYDGLTALHIAAYNGDSELVGELLQMGANPDISDAMGNTVRSFGTL